VSENWIDPGSLEGDALRQWYLRSPADVERERQEAAARRYQDFFYGDAATDPDPQLGRQVPASSQNVDPEFAKRPPPSSEDIDPGFTWIQAGPNRLQSVKVGSGGQFTGPISYGSTPYGSSMATLDPEGSAGFRPASASGASSGANYVQLAAASPSFWDYWSPRGCANCHGYTPGTFPPIGGQSPIPPSYSPRSGEANGSGGSQPDRRDKKECDQQYQSDSQICGQLFRPSDRAICRETASERYAYCLRPDGTIGFPHLETKGGRRP
jgi:hypothetical protein